MKRLRQVTWRHCAGAVIGLTVGIGAVASWSIQSETERSLAAAMDQCRVAAGGFAQAAQAWITTQAEQEWIDVDARRAFQRAAELLLLGAATYVQVVLGDAVLVDSSDADWSFLPSLQVLDLVAEPDRVTLYSSSGQFLSDVVVPLGSTDPTASEALKGYARVGYELTALADHLQTIRLAGAGIASAAFFAACAIAGILLGWLDHRGIVLSPFHGIVRSISAVEVEEPLVLDESAKQVALHGRPMFLPPKLFQLLSLLVQERGRVLTEDEIVGTLWPDAELADSRDVRQCVYLLRKRLNAAVKGAGTCIANVKGFGYRFDAETLEERVREYEPKAETSPTA